MHRVPRSNKALTYTVNDRLNTPEHSLAPVKRMPPKFIEFCLNASVILTLPLVVVFF